MSIGMKICLASDVSGVLVKGGVPLEQGRLVREIEKNGKKYTQEAIVGSNGNFTFPALFERSLFAWLPHQPAIHQRVLIQHEGEEYRAWELTKMDYDLYGEVNSVKALTNKNAVPFSVTCDLNDEEYSRHVEGTAKAIHGICLLNGERKPI